MRIIGSTKEYRLISVIRIVLITKILDVILDCIAYFFVSGVETNDNFLFLALTTTRAIMFFSHIIMFIVSAILFLMWFYRAYSVLKQQADLRYSASWTVWTWFVPVFCWFIPYQIMHDMYVHTDRLLAHNEKYSESPLNLSYVKEWWFFCILITLLDLKISVGIINVDLGIWGYIATAVLFVPLTITTIEVIKEYTWAESLLKEENTPQYGDECKL